MFDEVYEYYLEDIRDPFSTEGSFREPLPEDDYFVEMPSKAVLSLAPASDYAPHVKESGVIGFVKVVPPYDVIYKSTDRREGRRIPTDQFPPRGANQIYGDGQTIPRNLRDLVRARMETGWEVSPELKAVLFPADEGLQSESV